MQEAAKSATTCNRNATNGARNNRATLSTRFGRAYRLVQVEHPKFIPWYFLTPFFEFDHEFFAHMFQKASKFQDRVLLIFILSTR